DDHPAVERRLQSGRLCGHGRLRRDSAADVHDPAQAGQAGGSDSPQWISGLYGLHLAGGLIGMIRLRGFMTAIRERSPLTMQGLVVVLIAVLALQRFGYGRMDLVVFSLAVCALAIVSFSTIIVLLGGLILRNQLVHQLEMRDLLQNRTTRVQVEAGYPNETGFTLHTMPWLPLIGISWEVMYPDAIETRNLLSADEQ